MKYLFDQLTKGTLTLAKNWRRLRPEDEFRVYDMERCPVDGFDVALMTDAVKSDGGAVSLRGFAPGSVSAEGGRAVYTGRITDARKFRAAADFAEALAWCDCYVCLDKAGEILNWAQDSAAAREKIDALFGRINDAMAAGKKVYLGHRLDGAFKKVVEEYGNSMNSIIGGAELEEMRKYEGAYFADGCRYGRITLLAGTSSAGGKFSSAFRLKELYERRGERTALLMTEETYPFLDNADGLIYGFCRDFSDLTADEEFDYLRGLVGRIWEETSCDRIIIVSQGTYGFHIPPLEYVNENVKMLGMTSTLIEQACGAHSVALAVPWNTTAQADKCISYFTTQGVLVDALFITPVESGSLAKEPVEVADGVCVQVAAVGRTADVFAYASGMMAQFPEIPLFCAHADIQKRLAAFRKSEEFPKLVESALSNKILGEISERLRHSSVIAAEEVPEEEEEEEEEAAADAGADGAPEAEEPFSLSEKTLEDIRSIVERYQL